MAILEERSGRRFACTRHLLLVAVRSGAAISMPGMMDTVPNLGMTDAIEAGLARETGGHEYAADTRRRSVEQFEKIVGTTPPDDPWDQLQLAIHAVLDSWHSKRARTYRSSTGSLTTVEPR